MPSFGSVTSDQLGADGVAELVGVGGDDPDVGAPFAVCDPAPGLAALCAVPLGLAALLAVVGSVVAVPAVLFDFEHPAIAPIRRNAVKKPTTTRGRHRRRRRRRRGVLVKLITLCVPPRDVALVRRR
jgi:hypothetical protein